MGSFDYMNAVFDGYQTVWRERRYLMVLGAVPMTIIGLNFLLAQVFLDTLPPLRQGLVLLPGMAAEAWLVCQFVRTVLTGERWPMLHPGRARGMDSRARGLIAGMIVYLLINLTLNVTAGVLVTLNDDPEFKQALAEPNPVYGLLGLAALGAFLWAFRLLFLYLPAIMNVPMFVYLRALGGWMPSFHMIALWTVSALPVMTLFFATAGIMQWAAETAPLLGFPIFVIISLLHVAGQVMVALVTSTAMANVLRPLLTGGRKTP